LSDFDRKITIRIQPSAETRNDIHALLNSPLPGTGKGIPVRSVVTVKETEGYAEIWREGQQRAHVLAATVHGRSVESTAHDRKKPREDSAPPPCTLVGGEL
jgi:Cu/Ag efflux pump CusA